VKKPSNTKSNSKRHSDSDDNDDSDEPRIIKTLPSGSRAIKGASGIANHGPGLIRTDDCSILHRNSFNSSS
jgi:hypothetical protein